LQEDDAGCGEKGNQPGTSRLNRRAIIMLDLIIARLIITLATAMIYWSIFIQKEQFTQRMKTTIHPATQIGCVHYTTADLNRQIAFYHEILGFDLLWQKAISSPGATSTALASD
jgi:hypothetical protein